MRRYTTRDAAELLRLSQAQVRSFARAGLLTPSRGPRGEYRFSFQDILLLRAAKELLAAHIDARKVRRALTRLREQLPKGRPLSAVRIAADGDRVVVREAGASWNPESGQLVFDFAVSDVADGLVPMAHRVAAEAREKADSLEADDWYHLGLELEPVSLTEAENAYKRAIGMQPTHAEAHINLGRLLQERGSVAAAESHYREAIVAAPENATGMFNLGTVLEDQGRTEDAIAAYQATIRLDPAFTDAHFNLARLYEQTGELEAAIRHLRSFKALSK